MRPRRSSKFSQIGPPTAELAALECLKKSASTYNGKNGVATFSQLFMIHDRFYFILAGNNDIHESLDEFEIWPDLTTGSHGN